MIDLLLNLIGGMAGGALYLWVRPYAVRAIWRPVEGDRDSGSSRYQAFKDKR